jgi:hypothetical protein
MTEIERKALELVNEIEREEIYKDFTSIHKKDIILNAALHRAIEQHEAFRQEVSDAVVNYFGEHLVAEDGGDELARFIIAKPDPLVEVLRDMGYSKNADVADDFRAALAKRGLEIREKSDD